MSEKSKVRLGKARSFHLTPTKAKDGWQSINVVVQVPAGQSCYAGECECRFLLVEQGEIKDPDRLVYACLLFDDETYEKRKLSACLSARLAKREANNK